MIYWPTHLIQHPRHLPVSTSGISGLLLLVLSKLAFAQAAVPESPGVSGTAILQMLLGLTIIIAILFFGAFFLRKLNGGRSFGSTGPLKIVGGLMISTRERIVLVEVGDTWIVVGIVPGQIKTLHTLAKGELPAINENEMPFGQWLKKITERNNERK